MPLVISVAGSDPGRGAGLQMDARACWRLGVQFRGVVAVDTVQDDDGLHSVTPRDPQWVADELRASLETANSLANSSADSSDGVAIKTGALGNAEIIEAIAAELSRFRECNDRPLPLVIDPVRAATKDLGAQLLDASGWGSMKQNLFPLATIVTPNTIEYGDGSEYQNCASVFLKGGHRLTKNCTSVRDELWIDDKLAHTVLKPRIKNGADLHGTGCALSTAIAVGLAGNLNRVDAVEKASRLMSDWIAAANGNLL